MPAEQKTILRAIFMKNLAHISFSLSLLSLFLVGTLYPLLLPSLILLLVFSSYKIWNLNGGVLALLLSLLFLLGFSTRVEIHSLPTLLLGSLFSLITLLLIGYYSEINRKREKDLQEDLQKIKTWKKEMDNQLFENQTLLNSLILNVPGCVYRCAFDEHWTMKYISDAILTISGHPANAFIDNREIKFSEIIHPEDKQMVKDTILHSIMEDRLYDLEYRILTREGEIRWVKERGQGVGREAQGILWLDGVLVDITQQRLAREELSQEKRRLDVTLRSIKEGVIATDSQGEVLLFNRKAEELTGWTEKEALHRSVFNVFPIVKEKKGISFEDSVKQVLGTGEEIESQERGLITRRGRERSLSISAAPILSEKKINGVVLVFRDITQEKESEKERITLLEETRRGLNESLSLQMVTSALLQMINLEEILELVCSEAEGLTGSSGSCVFLLEGDEWISPVFSSGEISLTCDRIPIKNSLTGLAIKTGEPVVSNKYSADDRRFIGDVEHEPENLLAVPLALKEEIIGALTVVNRPGGFTDHDIRIISLFASQASVAIENARLYKKAQELAAMKERQRLARDLHDAVSQTLFSASLIAEVLPRLWEKDREEALLHLEELRELTRGALAEMRTLLLELRPQGLVETRMDELLKYLADAIQGRAKIPVSIEYEGEYSLPSEVHVAMYRILQEGLNNIVKHAGATQAMIKMSLSQERVVLELEDDGCGFDPEKVSQDRFGLKIMMERAKEIDAILSVVSEKGQGTTIKVLWPAQKEEENGEDESAHCR